MGKKVNKKPIRDEEEVELEEADAELEAELAAVRAIQEDKKREALMAAVAELEDDEDEEQDENKPKRINPNYNKEGLLKSLENLETSTLPFLQSFQICEFKFNVENELDDIEREMSFYNHALQAVQLGREKLLALGVPFTRPNDFFCEQVKSDSHMARIKDRLLIEEKRMDAFEKRKNREQNRKFNKQLTEMKKEEKTKEKKTMIHEVSKLARKQSDDKDEKLDRILNSHSSSGPPHDKSKKRKIMDKKYGFGGRDAKRAKLNDKKSINDMTDFNPRGGKFVHRDRVRKTMGKKGGNRPGKDARSKNRQSRKST